MTIDASWLNAMLCAQLPQQRLGVLQVGGVEALGEPAVDFRRHRVGLLGVRFARL